MQRTIVLARALALAAMFSGAAVVQGDEGLKDEDLARLVQAIRDSSAGQTPSVFGWLAGPLVSLALIYVMRPLATRFWASWCLTIEPATSDCYRRLAVTNRTALRLSEVGAELIVADRRISAETDRNPLCWADFGPPREPNHINIPSRRRVLLNFGEVKDGQFAIYCSGNGLNEPKYVPRESVATGPIQGKIQFTGPDIFALECPITLSSDCSLTIGKVKFSSKYDLALCALFFLLVAILLLYSAYSGMGVLGVLVVLALIGLCFFLSK